MDSKIKIALMASGNGSNAQSIMEFALENQQQIEVCCLVSDQPEAYCIERAKQFNIPQIVIPYERSKLVSSKQAKANHEEKILVALSKYAPDWICLAGYMRVLSSYFLDKFYDQDLGVSRIINIHPSLLPSFPGKDAYEQAYDFGVKVSGVTIHFVDKGVDSGPIIAQRYFERKEDDSLESFKKRGLALEHKLYPDVLRLILQKRISALSKRWVKILEEKK